jgi:hypothetical protein
MSSTGGPSPSRPRGPAQNDLSWWGCCWKPRPRPPLLRKLRALSLDDCLRPICSHPLFREYRASLLAGQRSVNIFKDKLPAGWAYALKPSLLEDAIAEAGLRLRVSLHQNYKVWEADAPALSAKFYPSGSYLGGENGAFSVRSAAIPSSECEVQRDFAERVFLPALVTWMTSLEVLPPGSTVAREEQSFACEGAPPALSHRPLPPISKGQRRRKPA